MKRHLLYPLDFDTRALLLEDARDSWDEEPKALHKKNQEVVLEQLRYELGEQIFEKKVKNFRDVGPVPFSIIAYHNEVFLQVRYAFYNCLYYPSLVAACTLGERILNHLLLDVRQLFPRSTHDRKSHTRKSIDNWDAAVNTLKEWAVIESSEVEGAFRELAKLRHQAVHFNPSTIESQREDALKAILLLSRIVEHQFGFQRAKTIKESLGFFFLRRDSENEPFIRHYYLPRSPLVSPYFQMMRHDSTWLIFDFDYPSDQVISDEEYIRLFNHRTVEDLAPTTIPWGSNINVVALASSGVHPVQFVE